MDSFFIFGAKYLIFLSPLVALWFFMGYPRVIKKQIGISLVIALPVAYLISLGLGQLYSHVQPFAMYGFKPLVAHVIDNSFPSHHTLLAAALAAVIYFFNRPIGNLLWLIALIVGVSRVQVGLHHPIDILASIVIAFFVALVATKIVKKKVSLQ